MLDNPQKLARFYRDALLEDVVPFWLRHGLDREHGGMISALDRDGSLLDTDKSVWVQGRSGWLFSQLYNTVEQRPEWLEASKSCVDFIRNHCCGEAGKLYFTVTRDGKPLRMRRYAFSESFAAIANAAYFKATGQERARQDALEYFTLFTRFMYEPGFVPPKTDPQTRPMMGIGPLMIGIVTAQQMRESLGDTPVAGRLLSQWIDRCIEDVEKYFIKHDLRVVMETVGEGGEILDHIDGRTLNPGHAIEAAWFIMHEGMLRKDDRLIELGEAMLDYMWERGWDTEYGGILYFRDLKGLPVQEYWQDMKFWWPQNETIIATLLAWHLTGKSKWADRHKLVHDWAFKHFADPVHGEWYGYLHRDGRPSVLSKGNMFKGPFHHPRMLLYCMQLLEKRTQ
jgi:N-acylglucosamine 2-epimerase